MVQQETIVRNAHEEGNENVADHFIWSETKMKNHNDNGRQNEDIGESDTQLNDVPWLQSHRPVVQNTNNDFEIKWQTDETNGTEQPGHEQVNLSLNRLDF